MGMNGGLWKYQYGIIRIIKEDMHLPSLRLRRAFHIFVEYRHDMASVSLCISVSSMLALVIIPRLLY